MNSPVILIPARFGSSRFPGKPLIPISGKSMIERVYANAFLSGFKSFVVTDDSRIEQEVIRFGGNVLRVDDDVPSGSERIALAYRKFLRDLNPSLVINVQGDEPLMKGDLLKELANFHLSSTFDMVTLIKKRTSEDKDFSNPNIVKAIWSSTSSECLYFSRQSIPFSRDHLSSYPWYQHIGVYSYRPEALLRFVDLPVSELENLEKLEQLRALENGFSIGGILTDHNFIGVDTPEDVDKVLGVLHE